MGVCDVVVVIVNFAAESEGTRQNAERSGSAGRIRTVAICGSITPICGSVIRLL